MSDTEVIDKENIITTSSVGGRKWVIPEYNERLCRTIIQKYDLPEIVARILAIRGIELEKISSFLNPSIKEYLPDPSHLIDMDKAAEYISDCIINQKSIVIFGDYDVDGATSSALLKRYFRDVGFDVSIYIPDRIKEGYGPTATAFKKLKENGADLVITVDCGTTAFEPIKAAKDIGLETIVIDHHLGGAELPEAFAVVNPNRLDETSHHKNLAAVGLCFLLCVAVNRDLRKKGWFSDRKEPDIISLLDLVALGTICDVMPLTGLNRAYVAKGLQVMSYRKNIGLSSLSDVAGINSKANSYHAGFALGPRINAGGRVGKSSLGAELLSTTDKIRADEISAALNLLNQERKTLETLVQEEAMMKASEIDDGKMIIVAGENWHPGVIGIVASRLKEKFDRPSAVISLDNGIGKGSARSVHGVDLGSAITSAKMEGILLEGGGHHMAAGFTVDENKIGELSDFLNSHLSNQIKLYLENKSLKGEAILEVSSITLELARSLERLGPFGAGNREPLFIIKTARTSFTEIRGEKHISCILTDGGALQKKSRLRSIAFNAVGNPLGDFLMKSYGKDIMLAGRIKINRWQGRENVEFTIEDAG